MTTLTMALACAGAGWPVFPCKPGSKEPDTLHGFKDATTDPTRIRAWWRGRPDRNLAIATGHPGPDVLDVDVKDAGSGWEAFSRLQRAGYLAGAGAIVRTPSGGMHVYFTGTDQPNGRLPRHYLDFRGRGGYVLTPPSVVNGQPYELLDHRAGARVDLDWQAVRNLLDPARPATPARPHGGDIGQLAAWVASQPEGNRNDGLYWAARRATEAGLDATGLVDAAVQAGLPEAEAHRTIASATRGASR
jgi:hypothetical protein